MARNHGTYSHDGWSWPWILLTVLFWVAVIVAGVLLLRWALQRRRQQPPAAGGSAPPPAPDTGDDPERLLAQRFARGEIDEDEYRGRLSVLRGDAGPPG